MTIIIVVSDKRTTLGLNTRTFDTISKAMSYLNRREAYRVTVITDGSAQQYAPNQFKNNTRR